MLGGGWFGRGAPGGGGLGSGLGSRSGSRGRGRSLGLGLGGGGGFGLLLLASTVVGAIVEPPVTGQDTSAEVGEVLEKTLGEVKGVVGASHTLEQAQKREKKVRKRMSR